MTSADDRARAFFSGVFVELWLAAMTDEQTRCEADFLEKTLRAPAGANLLDLACGGGRHSLELAQRGYRMTGVDISPEFLAVARATATERGLSIAWEERPMHDLPWQAAFDGAYCMGNSLGGLDDDGLAAFFRAVARALKPDARFVLETGFVAETLMPNLKPRDWFPLGDILYLASRHYDPVQGRLNIDYTFIRGDHTEKKSGFGQVPTYRELCRMIEQPGLRVTESFASLAEEPYQFGSHNLLLVATKQEG
jgi:SAM-dependent methyltransferase